jgi:hypothetical protein
MLSRFIVPAGCIAMILCGSTPISASSNTWQKGKLPPASPVGERTYKVTVGENQYFVTVPRAVNREVTRVTITSSDDLTPRVFENWDGHCYRVLRGSDVIFEMLFAYPTEMMQVSVAQYRIGRGQLAGANGFKGSCAEADLLALDREIGVLLALSAKTTNYVSYWAAAGPLKLVRDLKKLRGEPFIIPRNVAIQEE